jgi:hypothetical protein
MIDQAGAVHRARQLAEAQGWTWVEPAVATLRRRWFGRGGRWEVCSNAHALGAKVRVVLDAESGQVLEQGYIPR